MSQVSNLMKWISPI